MDMDIKAGSFASPLERWILRGMAAVFIVCAVVAFRMVDFSDSAEAVNYFLSLGTMMFTILLFIFCINTVAWDKKQKRLLSVIITAYFCCNLPLLLSNGVQHNADLWKSTKRLYTLLYLLSAVYWLTFWLFQKKTYRHYVSEKLIDCVYYSFFAVYCALTIVNHFTGFALDVLPDGQFVIRSRALFHMAIVNISLYMLIALLTVCSPKTKIVLLSYSLFPLITWFPVFFLPYSKFYTDIFSNVSMFADLVPMYLLFFGVYLDSGQRFLQREKDLQESRANAMVLKISPHFIANTMSSIVALCYPGAPEAGELATKFARYLRDNYADMTDEPMIPFSEELEHIRNYLAVEQVRFPGLQVEYEIGSDQFLLPTLTVQPLVENAVRHGISKRPDASGTVKICSFEDERSFVIRIEDDGAGYRPSQKQDGKKHVGIANAKTRLALLCGGTLTVTDRPERGTVCEIKIPFYEE